MARDVKCCSPRDTPATVQAIMQQHKIRRVPVVDEQRRLVGIVSLGDIALFDGASSAGSALCVISEPGGDHSQTGDGLTTTMASR